jgi:hypothetical protein
MLPQRTPISEWIIAVRLAVPLADIRRFQIFTALIMDTIWFSRNKLIHEAIQPDPPKIILQLKITHEFHISALPSLWSPPQPGSFKGNFDVAVCGNFAVTATVISNPSREIFFCYSKAFLFFMLFQEKLLLRPCLPSSSFFKLQ